MASSAKRKTTHAKRDRENAVRERRARKQVRKEARKQAAADALNAPPEHAPSEDAEDEREPQATLQQDQPVGEAGAPPQSG